MANNVNPEVTALIIGASAIGSSYLFQFLYNVTAEKAARMRGTQRFTSFGSDLNAYLSTQPNREAVVLVEGSVGQCDDKKLTSLKGEKIGAGKVAITTEYFKTKDSNTGEWRDTARSTENVRASVPFRLRDLADNAVIVETAHSASGFDQLLDLAHQEHLTDKGKSLGDYATSVTVQEIPVSIRTEEYLLLFGTTFAGYGKAVLRSSGSSWLGGRQDQVTLYPEEVGPSIDNLIASQELLARGLRWVSWILFVGGGCVVVFSVAPYVWRVVQGRRSNHRQSFQALTD